ncbi:cysteine hydrolase [Mameliella alba]|nr:cysteine hydrolase [Antarctobacter heliothermus]MBY6144151.1 cysteine hydrolase [Mameliella alba]MCA0954200.1 cysteine hydrolase [Mameliella alba]
MILGYLLASSALGVVGWLGNGIRRIGAISKGKPIGQRAGTALLMIDLQSVFWEQGPYTESVKSEAQTAILDEVRAARENGWPIVAIRQEWSIPSTRFLARMTMKGQAVEGTQGTELAQPFRGFADHELVKPVQDSFATGELDDLLAGLGVGRLRIVGLDFNYCVQKTALAARNRGFEVHVVRRGTLAAAPTGRAEDRMAAQQITV